jgi:preprotein translocase subunit SecD
MFGRPGSPACRTAARSFGAGVVGRPCYLAGPAGTKSQLNRQLSSGSAPAHALILKVNQGWEVLEAAYPAYHWPPLSDPSAQFFAVRDQVAVSGADITDPHPSTDQVGQPDVSFGFTAKGATEFQNVTKQIAVRGSLVSGLGRTLYQHFAVALGTRLLTIPYIDYKADPFGIPGNAGADIAGSFTKQTARRLAAGVARLPLRLRFVSSSW